MREIVLDTETTGYNYEGDDRVVEIGCVELINHVPTQKTFQCYIYNRWGQKVFESAGYVSEWDGTINNKKLPIGTYYYLIDLGPNQKKHTGPITIMR